MTLRRQSRVACRATAWLAMASASLPAHAALPGLADLSIEELSNLEITSASKQAERLSDAPSSVFVITSSDIRHSGAASLPEVLRLAPNLHVVRVSSTGYTVSARGFSSSSANKLLVLIDGRSVYTPLFSGVFWDVQDVMLEDIERIEVISGPGGTLWGVNAVNGVINVITRSAAQTQGGLVALTAGSQESRAGFRWGGRLANGVSYRVHASHLDRDANETESGARIADEAHHTQAGLQADWSGGRDRFSVQAQTYRGLREQPAPGTISLAGYSYALGPIPVSGSHLLGLWERRLARGESFSLQAYYDRTERTVPPTFADLQHTVDLQWQHTLGARGAHKPVWGLQYRRGHDRVTGSAYITFLPERLSQTWWSVFAQDEISLSDTLKLTAGARVERNDYTGRELLPNVRLAWKPSAEHLLWGAVSRTVRAPSRLDRDTHVPGAEPYLLRGGPAVRSETATATELGYRGQPLPGASWSATLFHTDYDHLRTQEIDPTGTFVVYANGMRGTTSGLELWGSYQWQPRWRMHAGLGRLRQHLELKPGSNDAAAVRNAEGANPAWWWSLRSTHEIGAHGELDLRLRRVARLDFPAVPAYTALDLRWGWQMTPNVQLSVTGQNVLGDGHGEFTSVRTRAHLQPAVLFKLEARL